MTQKVAGSMLSHSTAR